MKKGFVYYGMKFLDLFKENNEIDEKNIVGFLSTVVLIFIILLEVMVNVFGIIYITNPVIYDTLLWVILGSFGISFVGRGVNSIFPKGRRETHMEEPLEEEEPLEHERFEPEKRRH